MLTALRRGLQLAPPRWRPVVVAVQVVLAGQVVLFGLSLIGGRPGGFDVLRDGWLQGAAYVTCAVLIGLRPALSEVERPRWRLAACGLACRAAGFVLYLAYVRTLQPRPYPSIADAGWLAMYLFLGAALLGLTASRLPRVSPVLLLDAVVAAGAACAISLAVLPSLLRAASPAGTPSAAVLTNALYPVLDVALLLLILATLLAFQWRPPPAAWLMAAGVLGFVVCDVVYLWEVAHGTFRPGSPFAGLALVATALMALAAWVPGRPRTGDEYVPGLALPGAFAAVSLGMLAFAAVQTDPLPVPAVVAAVCGVTAAIFRTALSFEHVRARAAAERHAARQALMTRLLEGQEQERARIAADVHDDSLQVLAAVDLRLGALRKRVHAGLSVEPSAVDVLADAVRDASARLRDLLFELEAPALTSGLPTALEDAAHHVFGDSDIAWDVRVRADRELPEATRVSAYRIAREAMVNARKHAHASHVTITVDAQDSGVEVHVLDDGVGVEATRQDAAGRRQSGMTAMNDRAAAAHGWWRCTTGPDGTGTDIAFWIPSLATAAAPGR